MSFRVLSPTESLSLQSKNVLVFCQKHFIPQSIVLQKFLITRIVSHFSVNKISSKRPFFLLMKRFLSGFALQVLPKWLNKRAKLCIRRLYFSDAVKYMRMAIQLNNYEMADICADLLKQGRIGLPKNYLEAIQIADDGERAGNKKCGCLIRSFSRDMNDDFKFRKSNSWNPRNVSKSLIHNRLEDTRYFQKFERSRHFNPFGYGIEFIPDMLCKCIYCATVRAKYEPEQYGADCITAAKSGYMCAQYTFGQFLFYHDTSPYCGDKALYWYLKAALQGDSDSILRIAESMYFGWRDIEIDVITALKLFQCAKIAGNDNCDRYIELCKKEIKEKNLR
jgi:TPR repeat protein